jgi:hypothetical protein
MARKEKKYHYVYKTIDTRNGNFYIGVHSTDDLNDGYVGSGIRIRRIKYKHGKDILKCEILEFHPNRKSLMLREKELVNEDLLKEDKCMNLKPGGSGGLVNEEHKKKFIDAGKEATKRMWKNPEYRKKHSLSSSKNIIKLHNEDRLNNLNGFLGKKHTPESKLSISKNKKGQGKGIKNSQYGTRWITNGVDNKKIKKGESVPKDWYYGYKPKKKENN